MAGMLTLYVMIRSYLQRHSELRTWHGFSRDALRGWGGYLKIAVPSVIMLCGKWWTYEAGAPLQSRARRCALQGGQLGAEARRRSGGSVAAAAAEDRGGGEGCARR